MNGVGQLREIPASGTGVGLAADPAVAGLVAVTHHTGSSSNGTFYTHHNSDESRAVHRGDITLTRSGTTTVGHYDYSAPRLRGNWESAFCVNTHSCGYRSPALCGKCDLTTVPHNAGYYGYRFYAPAWERWLSRGPIGERGEDALYAFVENVPICYMDKLGLQKYVPHLFISVRRSRLALDVDMCKLPRKLEKLKEIIDKIEKVKDVIGEEERYVVVWTFLPDNYRVIEERTSVKVYEWELRLLSGASVVPPSVCVCELLIRWKHVKEWAWGI